jgi:anhydro-N-acetylmuramic acid kinase
MLVIGLMSGTSMDGVDAALVEIEEKAGELRVNLLHHLRNPYPPELRERIHLSTIPEISDVSTITQLNFEVGKYFALTTLKLMEEVGKKAHLIASHGQTLYHIPVIDEKRGFKTRSTFQIGEGAIIADITGIPVVSDFRVADMAAGGQGAPLVAYPDYLMYKSRDRSRSIHNIGGISNLTYIPKDGNPEDVIAFDTGPGNLLIDEAMRRFFDKPYDKDGEVARRGKIDWDLLNLLLANDYFLKPPPKTTGRETFNWKIIPDRKIGGEDLVATLTMFTVKSIEIAYRRFIVPKGIDEIIVGGGGSYNLTLMEWLRESLHPIPVLSFEEMGWNGMAREAVSFALLGYLAFNKKTNNLPSATGAKYPVIMGKISYPPPKGVKLTR